MKDPMCKGNRGTALELVTIFAISLMVRVACWLPVAIHDVAPILDEASYLRRAAAFATLISHAIGRAELPVGTATEAYGEGIWPPLHPIMIALGFVAVGKSIAIARLVMVLLSALTSVLVYAVTQKLATRTTARWAAGLHVIYPSFIGYSHLLWSENTYLSLQ